MSEILDFVVIFLLTIAIIYGFVLNRRIALIQESKKELANLFASFDNTILKAQQGIEDLKLVSTEISGGLQTKIDRAAIMIDDLEFLNEKAVKIGKEVDRRLTTPIGKQPAKPYTNTGLPPEEILRMRQKNSQPLPEQKYNKKKSKALEGLLEQISKHKESATRGKSTKKTTTTKKKSNEEVSVDDMLKALGYGEQ